MGGSGDNYFAGNVGIGTTGPGVKLTVRAPVGNYIIRGEGSDGYKYFDSVIWGTGTSAHGALNLYDYSEDRKVSLNADGNSYLTGGNVGIGTTEPATNLHIAGTTGLRIEGTGTNTNIVDLVAGVAGSVDRLDFKAVNTNKHIGFELHPHGTSDRSQMALTNAASSTDFSALLLMTDGDTSTIQAQDVGTPATEITHLQFTEWSKVTINNGNVGIGTTSPDTKLQVVGDTKFGDDNTNYASFASDGLLSLVGTARVTRDLWIDAAGIKAPGAKPATEVAFGTLETSAWEFSNEGVEANQESVSWRIAVPYDMDRTEEVKLRVGWTSASTGNCKWQLKYRWFSEDEDMTQDGEETLTEVDAASATANGLVVTTIEGINAPSATDATIIFKLTRLSADGDDTISDTVELHGVCFNYVSDKLGEGL